MANTIDYAEIWKDACVVGNLAGDRKQCVPMVVQQHGNMLDDKTEVVQEWFVADGVCGFAWLQFRGNTAFARWTASVNLGYKAYQGGREIRCHLYNQSMQRKEAWCYAVRDYLKLLHGIEVNVYSRMD